MNQLYDKKKLETSTLIKELPEPLLGHAIVKVILENTVEYLNSKKNVSDDLLKMGFVPVYGTTKTNEYGQKQFESYNDDTHAPITKGVIVNSAPDFWGEIFKLKYGSDTGPKPEKGDIVVFPQQALISLDANGEYQLLADKDITAIYRQKRD